MVKNKKLLIILTALMLSLLVINLPYVNVLFLDKIWIFYILLFFFMYPLKRIGFVIFMTFLLLGIILICSFLNLGIFVEAIGIIAFVFMCLLFVLKLLNFLKEQ